MTMVRRLRPVLLALTLLVPMIVAGRLNPGAGVAAQEDVTLDLWFFQGADPEDPFFPALQEAYKAAHPNVTLDVTMIPEDQYVVKLDTALAAGSPPDIGFLYEPRWVKAGKVLPLDETIAAHGINLDDFNRAVMQGGCVIEGSVYCLGSYTGAVVLFYNKAMFDAAGLDYPSATEPMTIDEYAALAAKLSVPHDDVTKRVWGASAEAPYWWMNRTAMFSDDGRQVAGLINDEPTKHAYEVLGSMVAQGYSPGGSVMQALGIESSESLFLQGKLAMAIGDFAQLKALEEAGIDYGVATLPVEQAGDAPYLPVWTDGWVVFSESQHPAEAMEFIAFVATEGQRLRVEVTGDAPLSAAAAAEYDWAGQGNAEARDEALQAIGAAEPPMFVPGFWDVVAPLGDAFNVVAEGEATASEVLDEVAPRMQDTLDQNWQTWEQLGQ
jgi:multiple sugar transport system substrate-binding protein